MKYAVISESTKTLVAIACSSSAAKEMDDRGYVTLPLLRLEDWLVYCREKHTTIEELALRAKGYWTPWCEAMRSIPAPATEDSWVSAIMGFLRKDF